MTAEFAGAWVDILRRDSGGGLSLLTIHPKDSLTWTFGLSWRRHNGDSPLWRFSRHGDQQRHYQLYLGRRILSISRQDRMPRRQPTD